MKNLLRGFTLIELLVALVVLSIIAIAGYRGLDAVLQTREKVAAETRKWQHVAFFFSRMSQDIAEAIPRPVRNADGNPNTPAMIGSSVTVGENDAELIFSRAGIPDAGGALQPPQRIGYRFDHGNIVLLRWPALDQAPNTVPVRYTLLEGVRDFTLRYLDDQGVLQYQWQVQTQPEKLPKAIEVSMTLASGEAIRRLFALQ